MKSRTIREWLRTSQPVPVFDEFISRWLCRYPEYPYLGKTRCEIMDDIIARGDGDG